MKKSVSEMFKVLIHEKCGYTDEKHLENEGLAKACYLKELSREDVKRVEVFSPNGSQVADSESALLKY